jgi:hypothetical protein
VDDGAMNKQLIQEVIDVHNEALAEFDEARTQTDRATHNLVEAFEATRTVREAQARAIRNVIKANLKLIGALQAEG